MSIKLTAEIINYLLPLVKIAGSYAAEIQERVEAQVDKCLSEDSPFTAALTDGDLSIQSFIEVALLAKYPEIYFYGEEEASSLNMKYFKNLNGLKVFLDPIDGTLFYKTKLPYYSVILTFTDQQQMLGSIIYQPKLNQCFVTVKGEGVRILTSEEMQTGAIGKSVNLNSYSNTPNRVCMYKCNQFKERLAEKYDEVIDFSTDFSFKSDWEHDWVSMLQNKHLAILTTHPLIIDSGSIAFAVQEAGGYICDFQGKELNLSKAFDKGMYETLLLARSKSVAEDILQIINT
jgi:myo-inositol-1(or 4)-monophosphatase